jgi:hypothetical protein
VCALPNTYFEGISAKVGGVDGLILGGLALDSADEAVDDLSRSWLLCGSSLLFVVGEVLLWPLSVVLF